MNMKKTIAAVAACAMAVSAMATTVSAVDENATAAKSVHYDLTLKSEEKINSAELAFTGKNIDAMSAGDVNGLAITVKKASVSELASNLTLTCADVSVKLNVTQEFSTSKDSDKWDGTAKKYTNVVVGGNGSSADKVDDSTYEVYVLDLNSTAQGIAIRDALKKSANLDIAIAISAGKTSATAQTELNGMIEKGDIKLELLSTVEVVSYNGSECFVPTDYVAGDSTLAGAKVVTGADADAYGASVASKAVVDGEDKATGLLNVRGTCKSVTNTLTKPMYTHANTTSNTAEVFEILGKKGSKDKDNGYVNVKAVINDMVANYDDVVFTFNTAKSPVLTSDYLAKNTNGGNWAGNNATAVAHIGYYATGIDGVEEWMGDAQYKSFNQHLYNLYGDEATNFTYSDSYVFNNLFNAALIANNGYTMNQSTVAPFEYSKTSVSFSWSDLTGGNGFVSAASYVNTLQLATSSDWYWDSMDVTGYELAAEDATTEAGDTDEGEDIDDEDEDDADIDLDDEDADDEDADIDVDDTDDVDVDAEEEVEAPVATNPSTGNAPIALAVIPVALAAAAVVAKKRG